MRHRAGSIAVAGLFAALPLMAQQHERRIEVGGVIYAQYLYQLADSAGHGNNFDVTRAYVNVTGSLAEHVGVRVTSDLHRVKDGSLELRLKYAYVTFAPSGGPLVFKLGQMQTPWLVYEETVWDYRMQGTTVLDRAGYLVSSDFGVGAEGSWHDGGITAQAGLYNGEGYAGQPGDRRKDIAGRLTLRLLRTDDASPVGGVRLAVFGQYGTPTGGGTRRRAVGMVSYRTSLLTLAAEAGVTRDRLDAPEAPEVPDSVTREGRILSAFGVLRIPGHPLSLIARIDDVDPDTRLGANRRTRIIGGVAWQVSPALRLLADIDHVRYEGGIPNPATGAARTQGLIQAEVVF